MVFLSGTKVPHGLDEPPRFLLVSFDNFLAFTVLLFSGALCGNVAAGIVLGLAAGWYWHRLSSRLGRHFGISLTYWYLGISPMKRIPPSALRTFVG